MEDCWEEYCLTQGSYLSKRRRMRKALHVTETAKTKHANQKGRHSPRQEIYLKQNVHVGQWQNIPGHVYRVSGVCSTVRNLECILEAEERFGGISLGAT